jgi:hypothetical protein
MLKPERAETEPVYEYEMLEMISGHRLETPG